MKTALNCSKHGGLETGGAMCQTCTALVAVIISRCYGSLKPTYNHHNCHAAFVPYVPKLAVSGFTKTSTTTRTCMMYLWNFYAMYVRAINGLVKFCKAFFEPLFISFSFKKHQQHMHQDGGCLPSILFVFPVFSAYISSTWFQLSCRLGSIWA